MDVQLDADPLVYGPKRLNGKVALVRSLLSRCERIFLDISQMLAKYKRGLRAAQLDLDLAKKHLLATDPEVRAGRAVSERDAIATGKLKSEVALLAACEHAVEDLDAILNVVKAKRSDLRDIQGRLKDQVRLCQEEIGLGGRWGSKSPRDIELEPGQGVADGSDVEDVNALIAEVRRVVDDEVHLPAEIDDSDPEDEQKTELFMGLKKTHDAPVFEFSPHCSACGEPQTHTPSGMVCSNGHGGAPSVPPPVREGVKALEPSATAQDVEAFFSSAIHSGKSRREQEEADSELDIDRILVNFAKR